MSSIIMHNQGLTSEVLNIDIGHFRSEADAAGDVRERFNCDLGHFDCTRALSVKFE